MSPSPRSDTSPATTNTAAQCTSSPSTGINVRGAQNAPGGDPVYVGDSGRYVYPKVDAAAQKAARWAVGVLNPYFQIKSLHDFNAKFDPEWLPRVLAYRHAVDLPRVGLLYAGAEGFLSLPVVGELLVPKSVGGASAPSSAA